MMPLLPAFWLAGMSMMLQVLSVGGTLVYPESPEMDVVLDTIERFGVNRVNAWGDRQPKLIEAALARGMDLDRIPDLSGFRDSDGNPLPARISMYGMTESFSAHSAEPLDDRLPEDKAESYGRAINGYERRVVDLRDRHRAAAGRGRRAPDPRSRADVRLLQGRAPEGVHAGRLLSDPRPRADRCRWLSLPGRQA